MHNTYIIIPRLLLLDRTSSELVRKLSSPETQDPATHENSELTEEQYLVRQHGQKEASADRPT